MVWNPSPKVAKARALAQKLGYDQVIVIGISYKNETMESITYGETKLLCDDAKKLGDVAYKAVYEAIS